MSYCSIVRAGPIDEWNRAYHDTGYGFPLSKDNELFERLALEINQAGLSWLTILKKKDAFHRAFHGFELDVVAAYGDADRARLLAGAGIIRNRLKVDAVIENARRLQRIRDESGSFAEWLNLQHPLSREEWRKLFKKTLIFTGGEIVNEFLVSTGYLTGAHHENCPVYARIVKARAAMAPGGAIISGETC